MHDCHSCSSETERGRRWRHRFHLDHRTLRHRQKSAAAIVAPTLCTHQKPSLEIEPQEEWLASDEPGFALDESRFEQAKMALKSGQHVEIDKPHDVHSAEFLMRRCISS